MSVLHPKQYLVLPHELSYAPKTHDRGLVFSKQTIKLLPETAQFAYPGDTTTFTIRNMAKAIDPRSIQLHAFVRCIQSPGDVTPMLYASGNSVARDNNYVMIDDSAHSILKTVTVRLAGGFQQDRVTDYNRARNLLGALTISEPWKRTASGRAQGYHPKPYDEETARLTSSVYNVVGHAKAAANPGITGYNTSGAAVVSNGAGGAGPYVPLVSTRNVFMRKDASGYEYPGGVMDFYQNMEAKVQCGREPNGDGTDDSGDPSGMWFSIPLDCMGLLAQNKFIYLPAIGGELNLDIIWEDANRCLWNPQNLAGASYKIGDNNGLYISYDVVSLTESYVVGLTRALTSGGINFDTEKYYIQKFLPAAQQINGGEFRIQKRFQSAKSAFVFFNEPVSSDWRRNDKTSTFSCVSMTRWQFVVDGLPVTHPIELEGFGQNAAYIDPLGITPFTNVGVGPYVDPNSGNTLGVQPSGGVRISEAIWELSKALRLDGDVSFASGQTYGNYYNDNDAGNVVLTQPMPTRCAFAAGVDLERTGAELSGRGMDEIVFTTTFNAVTGCELYFMVVYDSRLVVESGSRFTLVE